MKPAFVSSRRSKYRAADKGRKTSQHTAAETGLPIKPWQVGFILLGLAGLYVFLPQLSELNMTFGILFHVNLLWLVAALVASLLVFGAATIVQFVAGGRKGSFGMILRLQLAGNFFNHFLPFNIGTIGILARYYTQLGYRRAEAVAVVGLPLVFGVFTSVMLLLILSPITIIRLIHRFHSALAEDWLAASVAVALVLSLLLLLRFRQRAKSFVVDGISAVRRIRSVKSAAQLTAASLGITLLYAVSLVFSVYATGESMSLIDGIVLYLISSLVSNVVPTPGGIGGTEAALVLGLSSIGFGLPTAVAATLLFRLVSFWLPMLPGAYEIYWLRKNSL